MLPIEIILTIVGSIFASTGFWSLIQWKLNQNSVIKDALLGLLYDRIVHRCKRYIDRNSITVDELEDLTKYLFDPYTKLGGNGTAEALVSEVKKLPKQTRKEI